MWTGRPPPFPFLPCPGFLQVLSLWEGEACHLTRWIYNIVNGVCLSLAVIDVPTFMRPGNNDMVLAYGLFSILVLVMYSGKNMCAARRWRGDYRARLNINMRDGDSNHPSGAASLGEGGKGQRTRKTMGRRKEKEGRKASPWFGNTTQRSLRLLRAGVTLTVMATIIKQTPKCVCERHWTFLCEFSLHAAGTILPHCDPWGGRNGRQQTDSGAGVTPRTACGQQNVW